MNKFTDPIVIALDKPYRPKANKFGFIEIPYVRLMLLAAEESIPEDLAYTWSMTDFSSTQLTFQIEFANPLAVSMTGSPEQIQIEFHIQEFTDSNGKGLRDNFSI